MLLLMKYYLVIILLSFGTSILRKKAKTNWDLSKILQKTTLLENKNRMSCYTSLSLLIRQICQTNDEVEQIRNFEEKIFPLKLKYQENREEVAKEMKEISTQNINNLNNLLLEKKKQHLLFTFVFYGIQSTDHYMAVELKNEQIYVYESYEKKYNFEDSLKKKPFSITSFINYLTDITSGEDEKIKRGIEKIICVQDDEICQDIKTLFL